MTKLLIKLGIAAGMTLAALTSAAPYAAAQSFDIEVGPGRRPPPPPGYDDYPPPPPPYGYYRPRPDYDRPPPPPPPRYRPRGCDPRDAIDIARDYGIRAPRIVDITPRRVIVQGLPRRGSDSISFANVPGCPVLRR